MASVPKGQEVSGSARAYSVAQVHLIVMNTLQQDIDDLDRMVDTGAAKDEIRSQIRLISREVAVLQADYASLAESHAQLEEALEKSNDRNAELQEALTKANEASVKKVEEIEAAHLIQIGNIAASYQNAEQQRIHGGWG